MASQYTVMRPTFWKATNKIQPAQGITGKQELRTVKATGDIGEGQS